MLSWHAYCSDLPARALCSAKRDACMHAADSARHSLLVPGPADSGCVCAKLSTPLWETAVYAYGACALRACGRRTRCRLYSTCSTAMPSNAKNAGGIGVHVARAGPLGSIRLHCTLRMLRPSTCNCTGRRMLYNVAAVNRSW